MKSNNDEQYNVSTINLAIQILASFVSNDIPEYNELNMTTSDTYPTENEFYNVLANYIQFNHKNVYEPASEVCIKKKNKLFIESKIYVNFFHFINFILPQFFKFSYVV